MSRNFGLGSRDMGTAGQYALNNSARDGAVSFSTAATNGERWNSFTAWAKENDVKKMENVTQELVREYGRDLAEKVIAGDLAAATAQNYLSAVNSVMTIATKGEWQSVSPTKACGIEQRSAVRQDAPGALDRAAYGRAVEAVRDRAAVRVDVLYTLLHRLADEGKRAGLFRRYGQCLHRTAGQQLSKFHRGKLPQILCRMRAAMLDREIGSLDKAANGPGRVRCRYIMLQIP